MLIAGAELEGAPHDVRLAGNRIAEVGRGLAPQPGEEVLHAEGGALLPGLHDHHIHLFALAASQASARCGPPEVRDPDALARALHEAPLREGWVRGVGYHESVAGPLDRDGLDALHAEQPVRVQHRSGALWLLNSAGCRGLGLDAGQATPPGVERDQAGRATGRLFRLDGWLRQRLGSQRPPNLAEVGRRLASCGVTGVTDAGVANGADELRALESALASGELPQRLVVMGGSALPEPCQAGAARGPLKLMLAETELPPFAELEQRIAASHRAGRSVAIHCVTRAELVLAVAALEAAGARLGDRIEHAGVAPPDVLERVAALPLTVVTQPHFVRERGDAYLEEVEPEDRPWLYRARGFLEAGVRLGAGSDAPFGDPDPWRAMRAAVTRRTEAGRVLGPEEVLAPERALALFTSAPDSPGGPPRRIEPGAAADLCLLDAPWAQARRELSSERVRATWCAGRQAWRRDAAPLI